MATKKIDVKRLEKLAARIDALLDHHLEVNIGLIDWKTANEWRTELLSALGWKQKWHPKC